MTKRRSKTLGVYLNDDEYEVIQQGAEASGARSMGAYIKSTLFKSKVPKRCHVQKADPELMRHLAWVGQSLNQISRAVNLSGDEVNAVTAIGLYSTLAVMAEALEKIQEDNTP